MKIERANPTWIHIEITVGVERRFEPQGETFEVLEGEQLQDTQTSC